MSNSFFDKKPGIITILVLVVLAVLVVFAFEFKLNKPKADMYSASGKFERLALASASEREKGHSFDLYFTSDYDKSEKIGAMQTGSLFYIVSTQNGKTSVKAGSYSELKKGDKIVVFSKDDISRNKNMLVAKFELIK